MNYIDFEGLQHYHSLILGLFEQKHDFTKTYEEAISGKEDIVYFTVDTQDVVLNGKSYGKLPEDYLTNQDKTELQETINSLREEFENNSSDETSIATQIENAIATLDVNDTAVTGQYVSSVSETDGKITVTRVALPDYTEVYDTKGAAATAKSEAITSASSDATTKATQALTDAKAYANSLASNYDAAGAAGAVQDNLDAHTGDTVAHITAAERTTLNTVNNTFEITSDATTIKSTNGLSLTADTIQLIPSDTGNVFLNGDVKILTTIEREVGALLSTTPVIKAGGVIDSPILAIQTTADSIIYAKVPNLVVDGDLQTPTTSETSDIRKKDIKEDLSLDKCYELIDKCQTIIYSLKDQTKDQIGMIAQEVEQYFPELVNEDIDGFKTLAYSRLVVLCFKVLKDVIKRLSILENK